jgi:hypothetical protein
MEKQLILVVDFSFGLRVNEIPNKTFLLNSPRPFICSDGHRRTTYSSMFSVKGKFSARYTESLVKKSPQCTMYTRAGFSRPL